MSQAKVDLYIQQISNILDQAKNDSEVSKEEYADICETIETEAGERWDEVTSDADDDEHEVADEEDEDEDVGRG